MFEVTAPLTPLGILQNEVEPAEEHVHEEGALHSSCTWPATSALPITETQATTTSWSRRKAAPRSHHALRHRRAQIRTVLNEGRFRAASLHGALGERSREPASPSVVDVGTHPDQRIPSCPNAHGIPHCPWPEFHP